MKYVILVGDGMADEPQRELNGKTPLQVARTPHMDFFASHGRLGLVRNVPPGFAPGSDVANLSIFGYSPQKYFTGRAPLEAASMGVELKEDDIAFRCNLVSLEDRTGEEIMADYSGGGISTEEARGIIELLRRHYSGQGLDFYPGVAYRHLLVWRKAAKRFVGLETTPPHDITGLPAKNYMPRGTGAEYVREVMRVARGIVESAFESDRATGLHRAANAIWLWGEGYATRMPTFAELYGKHGVVISAVDLVRGIGRLAGLDPIRIPGATGDLDTDYAGKAHAALQALERCDLAVIHVEAPDEASHRGSLKEKLQALEDFDDLTVGTVRNGIARIEPCRILLLPDHPTPLRTKTHSSDPVPFVLYDSRLKGEFLSRGRTFDEDSARRTGTFLSEGWQLMSYFIRGSLSGVHFDEGGLE